MNTPIIALIGQPNVGKSSLFNLLVEKKSAIVSAKAGVTRDRQFSKISINDAPLWLVDTAGIADESDKLSTFMYQQTEQAIAQADLIVLMVDASQTATHHDIQLARQIQKSKKSVLLVLNKSDLPSSFESYQKLGISNQIHISCQTKQGLSDLKTQIYDHIEHVEEETLPEKPTITIVGKPNAGKSTLSNHYAKEDRCIVSNIPGTTRDAIAIELEHKGTPYTLIDTAGMRKKARISEEVEQYATANTLRAIDKAHTIVHLIDATENIARQDFRIIHLCLEMGKAVIVAINKIDCLSTKNRSETRKDIQYELKHVPSLPIIEVSATQGRHTQKLMELAISLSDNLKKTYSTSYLTRILEILVKRTPPPSRLGRPINLRLAHVSRQYPLEITIRGKRTSYLPKSYLRYLKKGFIEKLELTGQIINLKLTSDHNPYDDKKK